MVMVILSARGSRAFGAPRALFAWGKRGICESKNLCISGFDPGNDVLLKPGCPTLRRFQRVATERWVPHSFPVLERVARTCRIRSNNPTRHNQDAPVRRAIRGPIATQIARFEKTRRSASTVILSERGPRAFGAPRALFAWGKRGIRESKNLCISGFDPGNDARRTLGPHSSRFWEGWDHDAESRTVTMCVACDRRYDDMPTNPVLQP
jgi:hypothetical protein